MAELKVLRVNVATHRLAKEIAAQRGLTLQQVVERAIAEWAKRARVKA
jgi:predicted HicB family RNase H-like nuclease